MCIRDRVNSLDLDGTELILYGWTVNKEDGKLMLPITSHAYTIVTAWVISEATNVVNGVPFWPKSAYEQMYQLLHASGLTYSDE